jgi:hypothetical protein
METFKQELWLNDAVKDKLDGKSKQQTLRETRWFSRWGPFKSAFPAIVSAL